MSLGIIVVCSGDGKKIYKMPKGGREKPWTILPLKCFDPLNINHTTEQCTVATAAVGITVGFSNEQAARVRQSLISVGSSSKDIFMRITDRGLILLL